MRNKDIIDELEILKKYINRISQLVNEGLQANSEHSKEHVLQCLKQTRHDALSRIEAREKNLKKYL